MTEVKPSELVAHFLSISKAMRSGVGPMGSDYYTAKEQAYEHAADMLAASLAAQAERSREGIREIESLLNENTLCVLEERAEDAALLAEREEHAREVATLRGQRNGAAALLETERAELARLRERVAELTTRKAPKFFDGCPVVADFRTQAIDLAAMLVHDSPEYLALNELMCEHESEVSELKAQLAAAPDLGPIEAALVEITAKQKRYASATSGTGVAISGGMADARDILASALSAARKGAPSGVDLGPFEECLAGMRALQAERREGAASVHACCVALEQAIEAARSSQASAGGES